MARPATSSRTTLAQQTPGGLRSLNLKLTLAFLAVALLGVVLVAVFVQVRTQRAFDQFLQERSQTTQATLVQYYQTHGSWQDVTTAFSHERGNPGPPFMLIGPDGRVILGEGPNRIGTLVSGSDRQTQLPIKVNGSTVGWLLPGTGGRRPGPGSPEGDLLARITTALFYGAGGATIIALLVGSLLARTLTQPLRELTVATEAVARGSLGQQVAVRSRDELGVLAGAFNRMSQDLARANAQRRQMTADIAHDLRTPLSVLLGFTESLRERKLPPTQAIFDTMHIEALHLQHLIDDLRTLSLADAGELPLLRQPMAPAALLERAAGTARAQAPDDKLAVVIEAAAHVPEVAVDPERMAQVLGNLVSNAVHHTPAGGTITLSTAVEDGMVALRVSDTGTGIAAHDLPHVFERFYRGDAAREQAGSSGLGLAITRSLVEAHGGQISVTSTLGVGTTFTIQLPMLSNGTL